MVYSAIETTCFGLYWPSSGFYNIEEESINAVKSVRGLLIKRSLYQSPGHSVPSARAICKHGEFHIWCTDTHISNEIFLFHCAQANSGAYTASYARGTGALSLGLKWPRREADHYYQFSNEFKAMREATLPPPTYAFMAWIGTVLT